MEILGYLAAALIGIALGLIGGGGSILTVPVLVYLFGLNPLLATSYSLFIVGCTSMVGALNNYSRGFVNFKTVFFFGSASIVTVFVTRKYILPVIPENIALVNGFGVTSSFLTMVLFGTLMLLASVSMIRATNYSASEKECPECIKFFKLLGYGIAIGLVTGMLGAGGGFLLIPVLIFLIKLPIKIAIGTSLMIIALNSLIGFMGDLGHMPVDWIFLLKITIIAMAGILIGGYISKKVAGDQLRKGFGWFILVMGIYIISKEVIR